MTQAIEYRWTGTSQETLRQLLTAVVNLGEQAYTNQKTLEEAVYHLYESNGQPTPSAYRSDKDVDDDIRESIRIPDGVQRSRQDADTSFFHYAQKDSRADGRRKRRIAVHAHPHGAVRLMNDLVNTFATHPAVYDIKIAGTLGSVTTRLDTIIVYCYEDATDVVNEVVKFLKARERMLLPGSPAMMAPTAVQGVATADQSRGGSWGSTRTELIAFRAWVLRTGGAVTLEALLPTVLGAFKSDGIDPDRPSEYLRTT